MSIYSRLFLHIYKQSELEYRRSVLLLFDKNPDSRFLDCGCGDGEFTLSAAKKIGTKHIYGIDIFQEALDMARAKGIEVCRGDLNGKLPFRNDSFDVILANQVIEHLHNTDLFFREIYRVLRCEGYFVISTPNLAGWQNIFALVLARQPFTAYVSDEAKWAGTLTPKKCAVRLDMPGHQRIFTVRALEELLEYFKFRIERNLSSNYYPLPSPLARIICRFNRKHAATIVLRARR